MIGIFSSSTGVLLLPKQGTDEYTVLDLVDGGKQEPDKAQYVYSAAQDWEEIEGTKVDAILEAATSEYWLARTVSYFRIAIGGVERPLEERVFEHINEMLSTRVSPEKVLNRLLVAPLKDPKVPVALAQSALSSSFTTEASILDELAELQPLLQRLTDLWLKLPETEFSDFSESRETIWLTAGEKCGMQSLLKAASRRDFTTNWNLLAFHFATPQDRSIISSLGEQLSCHLFPSEESSDIFAIVPSDGVEQTPSGKEEPRLNAREALEKVNKQISAIAEAVSKGSDANADKFLKQLIQSQTSFSGGENYAVKSLCNIAQRCADMFRMDFEETCLGKALQLAPSDAYALVQYGDHLKRVGNYDEALKVFAKAEQLGGSRIAKSSEADVYSHQGDNEKAIATYKTIPDWSDIPEVLTAIADNLRKMGSMDEALEAYNKLSYSAGQGWLDYAQCAVRARAGIAEIAKKQGKLNEALSGYNGILKEESLVDRDRALYKLATCNILKSLERFDEAHRIVDEVVVEYPFSMQARFIRGSILGLIGQEQEGLKDLPESGVNRSWGEWLRRYYRGLLLLKLERYEEAKKNLVEELSQAIASGEDKSILRMAAALCYLGEGQTSEADGFLSDIPDLYDCHTQYLSLILKLHLATLREDRTMISSLKEQISGLQVVDAGLEKAVLALEKKNYRLALNLETDALLRLAA